MCLVVGGLGGASEYFAVAAAVCWRRRDPGVHRADRRAQCDPATWWRTRTLQSCPGLTGPSGRRAGCCCYPPLAS